MTEWSRVLADLDEGVGDAADDVWFALTAAGLTEDSVEPAVEAVDLVTRYVGDLGSRRVADLGCGVGRHLRALATAAGEVVGVEASPPLASIARGFAPTARVETRSFHDLAELGSFDVVCAFSHCLLLAHELEGVVGTLQLLRGAMPDFGLLVVEVMPLDEEDLEWRGRTGLVVRERRTATATGMTHRVTVEAPGRPAAHRELTSVRVAPEQWPAVTEEGGFVVEAVEPFVYADGTPSTFYFLRAQKGFNFLSDLTEFLESWADPAHPRNVRSVDWAGEDVIERVRPSGRLSLGQGASLSRHHPDFAQAVEPRIRPLVLELARNWGFVTYSSCAGHLVTPGPREVYSEAYCGVVAFANSQLSAVGRLVERTKAGLGDGTVEIGTRVRPLHGPTTTLTAIDVLVRRARHDISWDAYAAATERAVTDLAARIADLRECP